MKVKKTGIFYIFVNRKGFVPVKGRLIPLWAGVETFIHKSERGVYWEVSEVTSGCKISSRIAITQKAAINFALDKLSANKNVLTEAFKSAYEQYGMAPVSLERRP